MEIVIFLILFLIKLLSIYYTPVDADEVMWSVMAENILKNSSHYLFFTDQNFRGSLEAYILAPFQLIFGINEIILRINSLIFGFLTMYLIYKILLKNTSSKYISLCGVGVYFFSLTEIFMIQNKAWGGYVAIQFLMLLSYYLFIEFITKNKSYLYSLLGILLGLSFWINEQSIFFIFILLFFGFLLDFKNIIFKLDKKNLFLYLLFFVISSLSIFYVIIKKRMYFNLYETFADKFNLDYSFLNFNFNFGTIFIFLALFFTFFYFINLKNSRYDFVKSYFLNLSIYSFLVIVVNIYNNSFGRVFSEKKANISLSINFFNKYIMSNMLGDVGYFILALLIILLYIKFRKFKFHDFFPLKVEYLIFLSILIFPLLFIYSYMPYLTPTPRYLIIWWPVLVLSIFLLTFNFKFKKVSVVYILTLMWVLYFSLGYQRFVDYGTLKENTKHDYLKTVSYLKSSNYKSCFGGYWDVGLVMFYSNLEIKCFTIKIPGFWYYKFLDQFKDTNLNNSVLIQNRIPFPKTEYPF